MFHSLTFTIFTFFSSLHHHLLRKKQQYFSTFISPLSLLLKANKIFLFLDQKSVKKCYFPRHMLRFQTPLKPQNMTTTKEKQNVVAMLRKIENVFPFSSEGNKKFSWSANTSLGREMQKVPTTFGKSLSLSLAIVFSITHTHSNLTHTLALF